MLLVWVSLILGEIFSRSTPHDVNFVIQNSQVQIYGGGDGLDQGLLVPSDSGKYDDEAEDDYGEKTTSGGMKGSTNMKYTTKMGDMSTRMMNSTEMEDMSTMMMNRTKMKEISTRMQDISTRMMNRTEMQDMSTRIREMSTRMMNGTEMDSSNEIPMMDNGINPSLHNHVNSVGDKN